MLGAIIGDIVGSRWEFNPTNDYDFEWLSKENGFTDDTICTVAVADALLHERDFGESIHDWCNRYPHPMGGYGGRFARYTYFIYVVAMLFMVACNSRKSPGDVFQSNMENNDEEGWD